MENENRRIMNRISECLASTSSAKIKQHNDRDGDQGEEEAHEDEVEPLGYPHVPVGLATSSERCRIVDLDVVDFLLGHFVLVTFDFLLSILLRN